MGAHEFHNTMTAKTAQEAFTLLVEQAKQELRGRFAGDDDDEDEDGGCGNRRRRIASAASPALQPAVHPSRTALRSVTSARIASAPTGSSVRSMSMNTRSSAPRQDRPRSTHTCHVSLSGVACSTS